MRGHNIVVVNMDGKVESIANFDSWGDSDASGNMKGFIDAIAKDRIVLVATEDSAEKYFDAAALESVGARNPTNIQERSSWCLIGYKGASKSWIKEVAKPKNEGPAIATAKIPSS